MKLYFASVAWAVWIGAAAFTADTRAPTLKCPPGTPVLFPYAPENVYVLNGNAVDSARVQQIDRNSIESVEIVCAKDLHRVFGIEARRAGTVIFTAPGPHSTLKASLDTLVSLQQNFVREHGVFATKLADLPWNDASGLINVELVVTDNGNRWSATGRHRYLIGASFAVSASGEKASRSKSE